jgi:hypothetical protein
LYGWKWEDGREFSWSYSAVRRKGKLHVMPLLNIWCNLFRYFKITMQMGVVSNNITWTDLFSQWSQKDGEGDGPAD